ncbi:MAG: chemotaxis protein CheW [Gammaproteobacteria bacterium]|nr:chemotaxis protein CheW [Gammaproteobacteria bacterium]
MAEKAIVVRSQLINLEVLRLILPNTAIAEVVAYTPPELPEDMPEWFLGYISWRGYRIPVVSFEKMIDQTSSTPDRRSRIIILNSVTADPDRPFYALLATGIPRLMSVDTKNIQNAPEIGETDTLIMRHVIVDKQAALIPDQYELEARLKQHNISISAAE